MNDAKRKEKYIGSIRFFKHVILGTVALSVLIPVCACCVLLYFNFRINTEYKQSKEEAKLYAEELAETNRQLEECKAKLEGKAEEIKSIVEKSSAISWKLVLVNEEHPLPQDFSVKLEEVSVGQQVDARIVGELNAMLEAMRSEGMEPLVCAGYRSLEQQDAVFEEFIAEKAEEGWSYEDAFYEAKTRFAMSGNSEHHTGLAVDIVGNSHQSLDDGQAETKEAVWLAEHCAEYGFILRYPQDKTGITGKDYEPWHFRYVGKEVASYIMENKITLEEFTWNLNSN